MHGAPGVGGAKQADVGIRLATVDGQAGRHSSRTASAWRIRTRQVAETAEIGADQVNLPSVELVWRPSKRHYLNLTVVARKREAAQVGRPARLPLQRGHDEVARLGRQRVDEGVLEGLVGDAKLALELERQREEVLACEGIGRNRTESDGIGRNRKESDGIGRDRKGSEGRFST